jgi:hypothetical protein
MTWETTIRVRSGAGSVQYDGRRNAWWRVDLCQGNGSTSPLAGKFNERYLVRDQCRIGPASISRLFETHTPSSGNLSDRK